MEIRARVQPGSADGASTELVTEVWDNGLGVPADAHGKLFERFFRAHEVTAKDVEGSGLGLSIVRETVETLGGRAWLQPNPDGGSVFAFAVPCRLSGEGRELRETATPAGGAEKPVTRRG